METKYQFDCKVYRRETDVQTRDIYATSEAKARADLEYILMLGQWEVEEMTLCKPEVQPYLAFEVERVGEWTGSDHCEVIGGSWWTATHPSRPDKIFFTVYGRTSEGPCEAISDFDKAQDAVDMARKLAAGANDIVKIGEGVL